MKTCDNASVGVLISDPDGNCLVFERATPPVGIAPVAGHVYDDHEIHTDGIRDVLASYRAAAVSEVAEEVGLTVLDLTPVAMGWRTNRCRSLPGPAGVGHHWRIYQARTTGTLNPSARETRNARWATPSQLQTLADRTVDYAWGDLTDEEFTAQPGIEPVWVRWLHEAGIVHVPLDGLDAIERMLTIRAERGTVHGITIRIDTTTEAGNVQTLWGEAENLDHLRTLQDLTARNVDTVIPFHARLTEDGTDYPRTFNARRTTFTEVETLAYVG